MSRSVSTGPDVSKILELVIPVIQGYEGTDRLLITAVAERIAATRYRNWAEQVESAEERELLLACAAREEEIATRVEGLIDDAAARQARMREAHAELPDLYRGAFASLSLIDQFRLQAQAERAGSNAWKAYASEFPELAAVLEGCSPLEEESAACLEALIAKRSG